MFFKCKLNGSVMPLVDHLQQHTRIVRFNFRGCALAMYAVVLLVIASPEEITASSACCSSAWQRYVYATRYYTVATSFQLKQPFAV